MTGNIFEINKIDMGKIRVSGNTCSYAESNLGILEPKDYLIKQIFGYKRDCNLKHNFKRNSNYTENLQQYPINP